MAPSWSSSQQSLHALDTSSEPSQSLSRKRVKADVPPASPPTLAPPSSRLDLKRKLAGDLDNINSEPSFKKSKPTPSPQARKRIAHLEVEFDSAKSEISTGPQPKDWRKTWEGIKVMRKQHLAAVDTMGCGSWYEREPHLPASERRFRCLVALMLSSQTKDQITHKAMERLTARGLTVDSVLSMADAELDALITPVGFHNKKVQYLKQSARILKDNYNGDIPPTFEEITELPGVGPKMAHLLMTHAWNKTMGIGVDVHVHRIANRLKWVKKTKDPEETRAELESWLPREHWGRFGINWLLVGFGQTICRPVNPLCQQCLVSDTCPSSFRDTKYKRGDEAVDIPPPEELH